MIHIVRGFGIAALAYLVAIAVHFLWEAWIILQEGVDYIPRECRRWWCPDGLRNRLRSPHSLRKARREKYWWS